MHDVLRYDQNDLYYTLTATHISTKSTSTNIYLDAQVGNKRARKALHKAQLPGSDLTTRVINPEGAAGEPRAAERRLS